MTIADFVLVVAVVLLIGGFTALMIAVLRVNDSLRLMKSEMETWRLEIVPLVDDLRESTDGARLVMDAARHDLGRFDRVLGSAEAISDAVEGSARVTRVALSTPVIKIAALASGTSRAAKRIRGSKDVSQKRKRR